MILRHSVEGANCFPLSVAKPLCIYIRYRGIIIPLDRGHIFLDRPRKLVFSLSQHVSAICFLEIDY